MQYFQTLILNVWTKYVFYKVNWKVVKVIYLYISTLVPKIEPSPKWLNGKLLMVFRFVINHNKIYNPVSKLHSDAPE